MNGTSVPFVISVFEKYKPQISQITQMPITIVSEKNPCYLCSKKKEISIISIISIKNRRTHSDCKFNLEGIKHRGMPKFY